MDLQRRQRFFQLLTERVVVGDGAMGTLLYSRGIAPDTPCERLNLIDPDLIYLIHREYVEAGAQLIETNTFRANALCLSTLGLAGETRRINREGARLARKAAGEEAFVAGSVGPLPRAATEAGVLVSARREEIFREQMEALIEGGVDLILLETFASLEELEIAVGAGVSLNVPLIAQMAFFEGGTTREGFTAESAARRLDRSGIAVLGANCGSGPHGMLGVVKSLSAATDLPLSIFPNSGFPQRLEGRSVYLASPEYFAARGRELAENGASLVGGCCGTTPEHIRALAAAVDGLKPALRYPARRLVIVSRPPEGLKKTVEATFLDDWGRRPVVTVELDPPRGLDPARVMNAARLLAAKGVAAINLAENPLARIRMGNIALGSRIQEETGIPVIIHVTGRDRNLIGLHSEMMGAWLLGIRNVLAVTGDPTSMGGEAGASDVFDVTSLGLLRLLSSLNEGRTFFGAELQGRTRFTLGAALNPNLADLDDQWRRLEKKIEAGASFVQTQPVFCEKVLDRLLKRARSLKVPLLLGIMPLVGERNAEFLHNEVPGITIPDPVRERLKGKSGEEGVREGLAVARELIDAARGRAGGFYLIPPFGRVEPALELIDHIRSVAAG
ncbi:MAG: bifunctional homocysteine S-methyltransferase/methylenetetrahydrofolate reductase [Desulfuromonadaceae bacterium]|nr:bifunctional homocysteine S-methyltransferase/methylenetetrahydrofolate reductase [Desulfuromonadaceae bacterium]